MVWVLVVALCPLIVTRLKMCMGLGSVCGRALRSTEMFMGLTTAPACMYVCAPQIRRLFRRGLEAAAESAQATYHSMLAGGTADAGGGLSLALPHAVEVLAQRLVQEVSASSLKVRGVAGRAGGCAGHKKCQRKRRRGEKRGGVWRGKG